MSSASRDPRTATTRTAWSRTVTAVLATVVGALVLSSCSIYDVKLPGGPSVGGDPITVHAEFRDVLDLVPQSTVKVDDVSVGRVSKVELKGYTADVTLTLPRKVDLPDNARAEIRQTSLLGEKFISLSPPTDPKGKLGNGDVIPLSRTGRNPEVEEVLGALSLLLNGGGVGQLKTIAAELNNALGGRESEVRSVLDQLNDFMGQLNQNRAQIVSALDNLDRLARELRAQDGTIKKTLDDLPAAVRSIDSQRADLVKTLKALQNLSGVGVRVIRASKAGTIDTLQSLAPVLSKLAEAGSALPKSLQVLPVYPFVDAAVGGSPSIARNLHLGDYVNLNARLSLNLCAILTQENLAKTLAAQLPKQITDIPGFDLGSDLVNQVAQGLAQALLGKNGDGPLCNDKLTNTALTSLINGVLSGITGGAQLPGVSQLLGALSGILTSLTGQQGARSSGPAGSGGSGSSGQGGLGGVLGGLGGGSKSGGSGKSGGGGTKSGSGGGILGGILGMNRAGAWYGSDTGPTSSRRPSQADQLGALLLQGVGSR